MSIKSGRKHTAVIEYQRISRAKVLRQVKKMLMGNVPGLPVQHQKSGTVPFLQGSLRNKFLRQIVIKVTRLHKKSSYLSSISAGAELPVS
jgi:hypothetical protein